MEYTQLQAKESLDTVYNEQLITEAEYKAAVNMLNNNEISPEEICTAYIPYLQGINRHK